MLRWHELTFGAILGKMTSTADLQAELLAHDAWLLIDKLRDLSLGCHNVGGVWWSQKVERRQGKLSSQSLRVLPLETGETSSMIFEAVTCCCDEATR